MYRNYCWLLLLVACASQGATPKDEWIRTLQDISANPSREMALTEQESSWNPFAKSPYATGLRQFTDSTGEWLSRTHCRHLGPYRPLNADWSLRCGVIYAEWQETRTPDDWCYCDRRIVAEMLYNAGYWVMWEMKYSNNTLMGAKELCGKEVMPNGRKRSMQSCIENYSYPEHISIRQTKYIYYGGRRCR